MEMSNFVKILSVQPKTSPMRVVTNDPQWDDIESALSDLDGGKSRFFELSESPDEASVMTVYGDAGAYHVGIINNETEQSWLMFGPKTEERVEIGGNLFPKHQVCYDADLIQKIVRFFFESGGKSTEAKWFTIDIDE